MYNEDLSLAPHMQSTATADHELKGKKTVLIEPMQGSEVEGQTGRQTVTKAEDSVRIIISENSQIAKCAGALFK